MAEQTSEHDKKKEEEKMQLYLREQEMYAYRALLGDEKAKVGLSFMYDPPPGMTQGRFETRFMHFCICSFTPTVSFIVITKLFAGYCMDLF
jgi:hypothetical protein